MEISEIKDISDVELLLSQCSLPTSDIETNNKIRLFGVYQNNNLIACIGVEIYSNTALLRSLAVASEYRSDGIGRKLSEYVESYCKQKGVQEVYLLTETAGQYFQKLGYTIQNRDDAPMSIRATTQFSGLCPSSSEFMNRILNG